MYTNDQQPEKKKKINWTKIWQIVRDIILALLTADTLTDKI